MARRWLYQTRAQPTDLRTTGQIEQFASETPDVYFAKPTLSGAIRAGSFFVGQGVPPTDQDVRSPEVPDVYFQKPSLSRAIQSGSFFVGEIPKTDLIEPCTVFPVFFPKPGLSKAIQAGAFFVGEIETSVVPPVVGYPHHIPLFRQLIRKKDRLPGFKY